MDILVFSPHPDDDAIGCGGSIIKHARAGNRVTVAYMTSGEAGGIRQSRKELAKLREAEAKASAKSMGVSEVIFLNYPDGYLECSMETLSRAVSLIRERKPDIIYLPHRDEEHRDHAAAFEIVSEAAKRAAVPCFRDCGERLWSTGRIFCYEVWTPMRNVSYIEDISACIDEKTAAIRKHATQVANYRLDEAAKCLNRYRGIMTGKGEFCECFSILAISFLDR